MEICPVMQNEIPLHTTFTDEVNPLCFEKLMVFIVFERRESKQFVFVREHLTIHNNLVELLVMVTVEGGDYAAFRD